MTRRMVLDSAKCSEENKTATGWGRVGWRVAREVLSKEGTFRLSSEQSAESAMEASGKELSGQRRWLVGSGHLLIIWDFLSSR